MIWNAALAQCQCPRLEITPGVHDKLVNVAVASNCKFVSTDVQAQ